MVDGQSPQDYDPNARAGGYGPTRAYSHLAIRPFDLPDTGRKRVMLKIDRFRLGFLENDGVSGQLRSVMPPREIHVMTVLGDIEAIAWQLRTLAGSIAEEAARCAGVAAEVRWDLEDARILPAPGRIVPYAIPRPRPIPRDLFASHAPQPRGRGKPGMG